MTVPDAERRISRRTFMSLSAGSLIAAALPTAVRRGDWKLIVTKAGREVQLYDLASDPLETKDLALRHPECVSELKALLQEYSAKDR